MRPERHFAWHSYVSLFFFNVNETISDFSYNGLGTLRGTCKSYKNHYYHLSIIATHRYQLYPINTLHDDVIKWKNFQHYWPFVRGIEFPAQMLVTRIIDVFLDRAWINGWVSNREAGDLRRTHYDVTVMDLQKHSHGDQGQIGVIYLWYPLDATNICNQYQIDEMYCAQWLSK